MTRSDLRFLRQRSRPRRNAAAGEIAAVDLFCGCGGLSVGLWEAARRKKVGLRVPLAVDIDPVMAGTYRRNIPGAGAVAGSVEGFFPGVPGEALAVGERRVRHSVGRVDILLGGPPCQGHSNLNNHTRRRDERNGLYLRMARAAEVLEARAVLIENVPAVQWDTKGVVDETILRLEKLGYSVEAEVLDLWRAGVPHRRRRHLLLALAPDLPAPSEVLSAMSCAARPRTVEWAIGGEVAGEAPKQLFDVSSTPSEQNSERMEYLFEHGLHDLPDSERPPCHRDKVHSYRSVYGRMWWDRPAPTITTGFGSMGQGRFVHPQEPRTITPHEAARLQTFPDWFDWGTPTRGRLATMIGNAVPPLLTVRLGEILIPHLRGS